MSSNQENNISLNYNDNPILAFRQKEVKIRTLCLKKAPGFNLITAKIIKLLAKLTFLMNLVIRLRCVPEIWKVAEIIMIQEPGKSRNDVSSYRPISLLPIISKLFEKLLLKRQKPIIEEKNIIPYHQFGFRRQHSTIDQIHRITDVIEKSLEEKQICSTIFLDIAKAFSKVWHECLIFKLNEIFPKKIVQVISSCLSNRTFSVKQGEEFPTLKEIIASSRCSAKTSDIYIISISNRLSLTCF